MDFFNFIADKFSDLGQTIVDSLPGSPIMWLQSDPTITRYLSYVNWFIPIYSIIGVYEVWLVCILIYYVVQVILRWVKVIE